MTEEGIIRTCELCDEPGTTMQKDELGNDCWVCPKHAELLKKNALEHSEDWFQAQKGTIQ